MIKFSNQLIYRTPLSNIGTHTHAQIDTFVSDIDITTPLNNQGLMYNSTDSKFVNKQIDHLNSNNIGTNTHVQFNTRLSFFLEYTEMLDILLTQQMHKHQQITH